MKLKSKFSIIVAITVLEVAILCSTILFGVVKTNKIRKYQYTQSQSKATLCELINHLNTLDYWGCYFSTAARDWDSMVSELDQEFEFLTDAKNLKVFPKEFREEMEQIQSLWEVLKSRFDTVQPLLEDIQNIKLNTSLTSEVISQGIRKSVEENPESSELVQMYEDLILIDGQMSGIMRSKNSLSKLNNSSSYTVSELLEKQEGSFIFFSTLIGIFTCIILASLISIATGRLSNRIIKLQDVTKILAEKDFTVSIKPNGSSEMYSLMENINNMVQEINEFFIVVKTTASKAISSGYSINDSASSTAAATDEINSNIANISEEFDKISVAVGNAIEVINQMNEHVKTLVDNNSIQTVAIEDSSRAVNEAAMTLEYISTMAAERSKSAEEMHEYVADGDEKITMTATMLNDIASQLDEIHDVVTIINTVANQTNLLSMNAAIESAHAGEAGKGFSVVAEEIRKLAEETAKNAKKIKVVVGNIVNSVTNANKSSMEASEAFAKVSSRADQVITSLQEISGGIVKIDNQMQQIKEKTSETSTAADKINSFCGNLFEKQKTVSEEVTVMNDLFIETRAEINQIKKGTGDIVNRIRVVQDSSKESYKNMTELENILEEFKTNAENDEAVLQADAENVIENIISPELNTEFASDNTENSGDIIFDPDSVQEYQA